MFTLFRRISVLSLLVGSTWLQAGIVWEKTEVEVTPKVGETKIEVPFLFSIEPGQAVQILDVGTSCGCTTTTLEKRIYAPGEQGSLTAVFTPGARQGRQSKQVTIKTVEAGKETQTKLTLVVNLPELAKPEAPRLEWKSDETSSKSLKIEVKPGITLAIKQIASISSDRFEISLKPDDKGGIYTLEAKPVKDKPRGLTPVFLDILQGDARAGSLTLILLSR